MTRDFNVGSRKTSSGRHSCHIEQKGFELIILPVSEALVPSAHLRL